MRATACNPVGDMDKSDIAKEALNPRSACFCGSSFGNDPAFRALRRNAIGAGIAAMGGSLVFGGGGLGLMGDVGSARAMAGGAGIQGIMPGLPAGDGTAGVAPGEST